jgi:predicted DNA-binding antitoxin AbrB/MazE fold protein
MAITIDAIYENGTLRPLGMLPLRERQQVQITIEESVDWVYRTLGIIPCSDRALIEWEYDFGRGP